MCVYVCPRIQIMTNDLITYDSRVYIFHAYAFQYLLKYLTHVAAVLMKTIKYTAHKYLNTKKICSYCSKMQKPF